ncbi:RDD family protein [Mycoplasmopsis columboralis]|uniref:RDD family protein n=1 Tax=Mycoplasmopsis columboralis TaxID=171282 RepID=A0A449B5R1_9BACT|nr:RDD family protein [Mycoplasmopsis columboralis]VEU75916.1 RDD family protein [Mycoplasmopsis columboralis]
MYENSGFWRRFISNLLDFLTSLGVLVGVVYFFLPKNKEDFQNNPIYFYGTILSAIIWVILYFFIIPYFFEQQTIFQRIFKLKVIQKNHTKLSWKQFIIRNLFAGGFWIIIFTFVMILIQISDFNFENNQTVEFVSSFKTKFAQSFISALISYWFLFQFINNVMIIVNKKRLNLIDYISKTRVVIDKFIPLINEQEIKLIPYYSELPTFEYYKNIER